MNFQMQVALGNGQKMKVAYDEPRVCQNKRPCVTSLKSRRRQNVRCQELIGQREHSERVLCKRIPQTLQLVV